MASKLDAPTITRRRSVLACARCRARRVKCDRAQPTCSNCRKTGAFCQPAQQNYPHSTPAGTRRAEDYTRLSRLEEKVARLSREVDSASPCRTQSHTPPRLPHEDDLTTEALRGNIVPGPESTYFGPVSWGNFAEDGELSHAQNLFEDESADGNGFSSSQDPQTTFPDESLHETLLGVFRKRVDPLIRVLHLPTFLDQYRAFRRTLSARKEISTQESHSTCYSVTMVARQQGRCSSFPLVSSHGQWALGKSESKAFLGLLYSIYYAAVMSLIADPNNPDMPHGVDIFSLAATLKREVEDRVMRIGTDPPRSSLQLLQGMVLVMALEPEPFHVQAHSLQLSLAISRARELGLHRDGSQFGLPPIEIEVRRRIWAHLCILDIRYAEQLGCEPKITNDSYDTALPLNIDDKDLCDIKSKSGENNSGMYKSHEEIESSQKRRSPYSTMTFSLVSAEGSRLLSHILSVRYQARDAIAKVSTAHVSHTGPRAHMGRLRCIDQFEHKFQAVYGLGTMESSHPLQLLTSECASLSVARAAFLTRVMSWKEEYATMSAQRRDIDTSELFEDALGLATRTMDLIRRYANTPFSWYTKHFRDPYSTAFLSINLLRNIHVKEDNRSLACSVLAQLFPLDTTGRFLEHGLHRSRFGKLLLGATWSRQEQCPRGHPHSYEAEAGTHRTTNILPSSIATEPSAMSLPVCTAGEVHFQVATGVYTDMNAIMDDSLWSSAVSGIENPYSSWDPTSIVLIPTPTPRTSGRLQLQPRSTAPSTDTYATHPMLGPSPTLSQTSSATSPDNADLTPVPNYHLHPLPLSTEAQATHSDEGFVEFEPSL